MGVATSEKKILVLCDSPMLAKALRLNLQAHWPVGQTVLHSSLQPQCQVDDCGLIILALSSPASEPVVALTRAALAQYLGRIPLLIISDRPFPPSPHERIAHLDFPFTPTTLNSKVEEILELHRGGASAA